MRRPVPAAGTLVVLAGPAPAEGEVRRGKGWPERIEGYPVLHVAGSPCETGYPHGTLLREECLSLLRPLLVERREEGAAPLSAGERHEALAGKAASFAKECRRSAVEDARRLMDAPVAMRSDLHDARMAPATGRRARRVEWPRCWISTLS